MSSQSFLISKIMKPANITGKVFQAKEYPSKRFIPFKRELISLDSQALSRQIIKRTNVIRWTFCGKVKEEDQAIQHVQKKIQKIAKSAKRIKKLVLDLRECEYSNTNLPYPHVLKNLKSLKQIALSHKISPGGKIGIYSLVKSLKGLSPLEGLSLNLLRAGTRVEDQDLHLLCQRLKKFPFLRNLSLCLDCFNGISEEGLTKLNSSFSRLFRLRSLSIGLSNYRKEFDGSLEYLDLRRLVSLREIDLSFYFCSSLTNKGILFLSQKLEGMTCSLQNLRLNFSNSSGNFWNDFRINSNGFICLWKMLANLSSLEQLEVDFTGWGDFKETGLMEVRKALKKLTLLKKVSLIFSGCPQIDGILLSYLGSGLASLGFLKNIRLLFDKCSKISASDAEEFIKDLNYFQGFEVFQVYFKNYSQEQIRSFVQSRGENRISRDGEYSLYRNSSYLRVESGGRW